MISAPDALIIGGNSQGFTIPGVMAIGSASSPAKSILLDLTAQAFDTRLTYTGPAHFYWNAAGAMVLSDQNVWPLEYQNGIAIGRHAPEPAATNLQLQMRGNVAVASGSTGQFIYSTSSGYAIGTGPDGGGISSVNSDSVLYGVYDQTNAKWLVDAVSVTATAAWQRIKSSLTASGIIRTYTGRKDSTNYLYALCTLPQSAIYTVSHYRKLSASLLTGFVQIEAGSVATSPVLTTTATATRAVASVTVDTTGYSSLLITYSDGTTEAGTPVNNVFTLPLSSLNWGDRYLQSILLGA